ncbi:UDP-glycosyltransferase 90A1-like [Andrographis paniculata]|uniref:UDP-glycosyltransferase 90A1-like n=1 Tax=Andrographis paniculata TaxID=175694 RepID=UPI0021E72FFE|nr:UDP-glycosyltransferase 90A1-like [Andrographis paniculata]
MGSLPPPHGGDNGGRHHFVIFPFMSQGHTIPLLHLSRLLHTRRSAAVTLITTPGNAAAIRAALHDLPAISVVVLPFPDDISGVPAGVENTHNLPSMAAFLPFAKSTKFMSAAFETALDNLRPPPSAVVSDAFLSWTLPAAERRRIPRLAFFGMGAFSTLMHQILGREKPHRFVKSLDEPFSMPGFDHLKFTGNDFEPPFNAVDPAGEYFDFMSENLISVAQSFGVIKNTFYEFEKDFVDCWNEKIGPKAFCIGPLCLAAPPQEKTQLAGAETAATAAAIEFLDGKLGEGVRVLYVSFGTQAEVSGEQAAAIAAGLEAAGVSFLWVVRENWTSEFFGGFKERTRGRGVVVEGWVDQVRVLNHGGVGWFLSHGGWNSVTESVAAAVPVVAMPVMADQHANARFVAEVAAVGVRVMAEGGSVRGFVSAAEVERAVREVMEGGAAVRGRVAEWGAAARGAMEEGGSAIRALDRLIEEVGRYNKC